DIDVFTARLGQVFDFSQAKVLARRGGLIPVGGLVNPFARGNVILLGDAAGIVSPLTAGGIHTALHYGTALGNAIAAHLHHGGTHPAQAMQRVYPRFRAKRILRTAYETLAPNWLLDAVLTNPLFTRLASDVFFKKKQLR
ncbi:MAG: FAD-dependent monooxygenase, partial [Pseudomonadota bacterium]|nr:FAD-dependent monooxygenase [Pseudomonadota bacterium]